MAREYDAQLLESVAVRRARMRELLLWGRGRRAKLVGDNLNWLRIGVILAAVACAACVIWSLVRTLLAEQQTPTRTPARASAEVVIRQS
ncbi:MAG: hypothetical protein JXA67_12450 [Micromonosporaceae bacterium]|nr:hypothetical protein [Micromonosporaceae bacterium]